jgi:hypothetical protein
MNFNRLLVVLAALVSSGVGCGGGGSAGAGGGGGGGTGPAGLAGIPLPSEVSALPTNSSPPATAMARAAQIRRAALVPPAGSDYAQAVTQKFVSEQALSQFDILNTIFTALAQTHYDDPANVNGPAYTAIVSWVEKNQGQDQKRLVKWTVLSTRASDTAPNVVDAWFTMPMGDGTPQNFMVKAVITSAPVPNPDGSYSDYGEWQITAQLEGTMPFEFVASAVRDAQGRAVVKLGQSESKDPLAEPSHTRGILIKAATAGFGKVDAPNYQNCQTQPCPQQLVAYAYNASDVTLKKGSDAPITKSRTSFVDIVNRYGLFDATTGADVAKTYSFGFPVKATVQGAESYGYYGAWQGRHQLWVNGNSVPEGLTVTRGDVPPTGAPTYTTSKAYPGIMVQRSYAPAQLSDLTGLVVETWDNQNFQLGFDGTSWCVNPTMSFGQSGQVASCGQGSTPFSDFASLENDPNDMRRNVMLNAPPPFSQGGPPPMPLVYVYLSGANAPAAGAGFYSATQGMNTPHPVRNSDTKATITAGSFMWVNIGGPIYISWTGSSWVRKQLASFDQTTWTPTFNPSGDVAYQLQTGREYYFNNSGTNYVVNLVNGVPDVKLEIQSVAHPWDAATFVPAGTVFTQQWCGQTSCPTFEFVTDAASPDFMKLVYKTVPVDDKSGKLAGDLVDTGMWGLQATIGGATVQFNWEYPPPGQQGGVQQFLLDGSAYVQLHDPLRLDSVTLSNTTETRTFSLQFDGNWMQGLPNVWDELRLANFEVTDAVKAKVFSITDGDLVAGYLVKQLQVCQYMATSAATPLPLTEAQAIDLTTVPAWAPTGIGAKPSQAPLKYSEGKAVQ